MIRSARRVAGPAQGTGHRICTRLLAASLLLSLSAVRQVDAQLVELTAGASSLLSAEGGTLTLHTEKATTELSAGLSQGHFVMGGAAVRETPNGHEWMGEQGLRIDLPTDVFATGRDLVGVGLGREYAGSGQAGLRVFAGFLGGEEGNGLFPADRLSYAGALLRWEGVSFGACRPSALALAARAWFLFGSVRCALDRHTSAGLTVGRSGGHDVTGSLVHDGYRLKLQTAYVFMDKNFHRGPGSIGEQPEVRGVNVAASYRIDGNWTLSGVRQTFQAPGTAPSDPNQLLAVYTLEQARVQYSHRETTFAVSLLSSHGQQFAAAAGPSQMGNHALALSASHTFGPLQVAELATWGASTGDTRHWSSYTTGALRLNARISLSEAVHTERGTASMAHGGRLVLGFGAFEVDHELVYLAADPRQSFQQALVLSGSAMIAHRVQVELATTMRADGTPAYTVKLGSIFAHQEQPARIVDTGMGLHVVMGDVTDGQGKPVEGAALLIGDVPLYTGADGSFCFRERKRKTHPFRVAVQEFLDGGQYEVVNAPASVASQLSGEQATIHVVVRRQPFPSVPAGAQRADPRETL